MSDTFYLKRGDTSPSLRYALEPETVDLAGALVQFQMRPRGGETLIDAPATVVATAASPTVEYGWTATDTAEAGVFDAEFRVTFADGAVETFPNFGFLTVRISDDIT